MRSHSQLLSAPPQQCNSDDVFTVHQLDSSPRRRQPLSSSTPIAGIRNMQSRMLRRGSRGGRGRGGGGVPLLGRLSEGSVTEIPSVSTSCIFKMFFYFINFAGQFIFKIIVNLLLVFFTKFNVLN